MLGCHSFKQTFMNLTTCSTWLQPLVTWNIVSNKFITQIRLALACWKANY
jgi:hypothetical protein